MIEKRAFHGKEKGFNMIINNYGNYQYQQIQKYKPHKQEEQKTNFNEILQQETLTTELNKEISFTEQVDALYKKQTSLLDRRNIQGKIGVTTEITDIPPQIKKFLSMSFEEKLASSEQYKINATAAAKAAPVVNTSLKWYKGASLSLSGAHERMNGAINVTVGKNELPKLMEEIEKALSEGKSYLTVIEKFYDNKISSGDAYDEIFINPYTGDVKHARPVSFAYMGAGDILHSISDDDAVWDLAYDLQQFLKLRIFGETGDLSEEEVENKIAEIKESQANKNTWRF